MSIRSTEPADALTRKMLRRAVQLLSFRARPLTGMPFARAQFRLRRERWLLREQHGHVHVAVAAHFHQVRTALTRLLRELAPSGSSPAQVRNTERVFERSTVVRVAPRVSMQSKAQVVVASPQASRAQPRLPSVPNATRSPLLPLRVRVSAPALSFSKHLSQVDTLERVFRQHTRLESSVFMAAPRVLRRAAPSEQQSRARAKEAPPVIAQTVIAPTPNSNFHTGSPTGLDVERLADQVLRQLDRRVIAMGERLGRT